jgi:histidyl-tRNA synthetase
MISYALPKGTRDFLPEDMYKVNEVLKTLRKTFEKYGFQQIQTPTFEEFNLFAKRSGEQIRENMFTFVSDEIEYALRPEVTAAVCRMIATKKLQSAQLPKPYRFYYIGQCFRYEQPQAERYREFWQVGLELMGSTSPITDAEVICTAVKALDNLGLKERIVKVGNIGIFRDILANEGFDDEFQNKIIGDVDKVVSIGEKSDAILKKESINNDDIAYLKNTVGELYELQEEIHFTGDHIILPPSEFNKDNAVEWLQKIPKIAEDTFKFFWIQDKNIKNKTADLIMVVALTRGGKEEIINKAQDLLIGSPAEKSYNELLEVLKWLEIFGIKDYVVILGKARGLDFYTGTVFEIDCPLLGAQKQICGGGRYDNLVSELEGPKTPATGYAFGLDRLISALSKAKGFTKESKLDIFIATISEDLKVKAVEVAEMLRSIDKKVEIDVMDYDLKTQFGYADKKGAKYSIIIGPDELLENKVMVKNMKTKEQGPVEIFNLIEYFSNKID